MWNWPQSDADQTALLDRFGSLAKAYAACRTPAAGLCRGRLIYKLLDQMLEPTFRLNCCFIVNQRRVMSPMTFMDSACSDYCPRMRGGFYANAAFACATHGVPSAGDRGVSLASGALYCEQGIPAPLQEQACAPSQGRFGWFSQT
jgi:hypothetical protein